MAASSKAGSTSIVVASSHRQPRATGIVSASASTKANTYHSRCDEDDFTDGDEQNIHSSCRLCSLPFHADDGAMILEFQPCGCTICKDCAIQGLAETIVKIINGKQGSKSLHCFSCHQVVDSHGGERFRPRLTLAAATTKKQLSFCYSLMTATTNAPATPGGGDDDGQLLRTTGTCSQKNIHRTGTISEKDLPKANSAGFSSLSAAKETNNSTKNQSPQGKKNETTATPTQSTATPPKTAAKRGRPKKRPPPAEVEGESTVDKDTPSPVQKKRKRTPFEKRVQELQNFKNEHGHCNVSSRINASLARWVHDVRRGHVRVKGDKRKTLDQIGFEFVLKEPKRRTFEQRIQELQNFKEEHGHCEVPYRAGSSLGEWVKEVRRGRYKVTMDQRKVLNQIGFNWETKYSKEERRFKAQIEKLKVYKAKYGHCLVPCLWKEDQNFAYWLNWQRRLFQSGELKPHRKKILEDVGMVWNLEELERKGRTATRNKVVGKNINQSSPQQQQQEQEEENDEDTSTEDDEEEVCDPPTNTDQLVYPRNIATVTTHHQHPVQVEHTLPATDDDYSFF